MFALKRHLGAPEVYVTFVLALILRLIFVRQWWASPFSLAPFLDAKAYDDWAMRIADGEWLSPRAFYQSPLYPYLLAAFYRVVGHSQAWVSVGQAALGALSCAGVAAMARLYYGSRAAWVSGFLMSLDRVLIFYSAPVMKETLTVLALVVVLHFALRFLHEGRRAPAVGFGLSLGLTALLRGNILLIAPALAGLAFVQFGRRAWGPLIWAGLATLAMIAPATLHNWWVSDDFVLINSCGGLTFYAGNSPSATGANSYPPFISSDIAEEERDSRRIAERTLGRELRPSEVSAYWLKQGRAYFRAHPERELWLWMHKAWYFWNDREIPDNYDADFLRRRSETLLALPLINFGLVALLAVFGLGLTLKSSRASRALVAFNLAYFASVLPFLVSDRYRLPELVFLFPAVGAGIEPLRQIFRERRWRLLGLPALATLAVSILVYLPTAVDEAHADAFNFGLQAALLSDAGQDEVALSAIDQGLAAEPSGVNADALIKASTSAERRGDLKRAEGLLEQATVLHPDDGYTFYNLGRFLAEHGSSLAAEGRYRHALAVTPHLYQAYIGLGVLYISEGRVAEAAQAVREGRALNPENPQLVQLQTLITNRAAQTPSATVAP